MSSVWLPAKSGWPQIMIKIVILGNLDLTIEETGKCVPIVVLVNPGNKCLGERFVLASKEEGPNDP